MIDKSDRIIDKQSGIAIRYVKEWTIQVVHVARLDVRSKPDPDAHLGAVGE